MDIINIGNDIRIDFKLNNVKLAYGSDIKSLRCYFVSHEHLYGSDNCFTHIKGEPFPQYYNPTEYTIHSCGFPVYNVMPHNICNHHCFCGFGVNSRRFYCEDLCHHHNRAYGCNIPNGWDTTKPLTVYFPGHDQRELGLYKLIVHVILYEQGWGCCNTHEYLINYDDVFKLVMNGGMSGNIQINLTGEDIPDDPSQPDQPVDPDPPVNQTYWYVGLITKTRSQFKDLTEDILVSNATKYPTSTKSANMTINKSCWYVMIPTGVTVKNATFTAAGMTSTATQSEIINRTVFDIAHDDIFIGNKLYKVYAYRNSAFTETPAASTFNIE